MTCKVCNRSHDETEVEYMSMMWRGTVVVDGNLCRDCTKNIVALVNNFFTLRKEVEKLMNTLPYQTKNA